MTLVDAEQYLNTVLRPLLVVQSSHGLLVDAIQLSGRYQLGWYDSLIVAAAIQGECSRLYSEDLQHGRLIKQLRIHNPFRD